MKVFLPICLMFFSYLLGSIPFGILIGKLKGVDIRNYGSHNIGATNALTSSWDFSFHFRLF